MDLAVDGRRAFAYTGGRPFDPARLAVAFVHGAAQDHSVWVLQTRWVAHHGWSVLALDLPGHGRSAGPALTSVEAMADWVLAALAAAGARAAVVVGHSLGSLVALECAARAPDRVRGVALVGTAFPMKVSDTLLEAARHDEPAAFDMVNQWSHARLVHSPGNPGPGFSVFVQCLRLMQRQPAGALAVDLAACSAYTRGAEQAAALSVPALFVLGARDSMTPPRAARSLVAARPGSTVVEIDGCGHNVMGEAPDRLRAALAAWLPAPALDPSAGAASAPAAAA
jgi:pimeloyl-ACP methyl ester carboxylesterase